MSQKEVRIVAWQVGLAAESWLPYGGVRCHELGDKRKDSRETHSPRKKGRKEEAHRD